MSADSKLYLEDAMSNLAATLDYGARADGDPHKFLD